MIARILLWLCARFNVHPIDDARLHHGIDAVQRGQRWEQFYREQGGLKDMILAVRKGYFDAASALGLSERDKLYEYALADRIAKEIERQVLGVVATGQFEAKAIEAEARNKIATIRR